MSDQDQTIGTDTAALGVSADGAPQTTPKIVWDDSAVETTYSNVCNVVGNREELMVLFGTHQNWQGGDQSEVNVRLSHRMVMTPHAAKRLALMLQLALKQYEDKFGEVKL